MDGSLRPQPRQALTAAKAFIASGRCSARYQRSKSRRSASATTARTTRYALPIVRSRSHCKPQTQTLEPRNHFLHEERNFLQVVEEGNRGAGEPQLAHLRHVGNDVVRCADQWKRARISAVVAFAGSAHEAVYQRAEDFVARDVFHHRATLATVIGLAVCIRHLRGEVVIEVVALAPL